MLKTFRFATYNIQKGIHSEAIIANMQKMASGRNTFFCLQEVWYIPGRPFIGKAIEKTLGERYAYAYFLGDNIPRIDPGLCLAYDASLLKMVDCHRVYLPSLKKLNFLEKLRSRDGRPVKRGALIADFETHSSRLRVTNIHLDWQGGAAHRKRQLEHLVSRLKGLPQVDADIIAGDFNTVGPSVWFKNQQDIVHQIIGSEFTDVFPTLSWSSDMTSIDPAAGLSRAQKVLVALGVRFRQRLDYVFARNLHIIEAQMEKLEGSDHFPLTVTFGLGK